MMLNISKRLISSASTSSSRMIASTTSTSSSIVFNNNNNNNHQYNRYHNITNTMIKSFSTSTSFETKSTASSILSTLQNISSTSSTSSSTSSSTINNLRDGNLFQQVESNKTIKEEDSIDYSQEIDSIDQQLKRLQHAMKKDGRPDIGDDLLKMIEMQTDLELQVAKQARDKYRNLVVNTQSISRASGLGPIKNVLFQWHGPLFKHLEKNIAKFTSDLVSERDTPDKQRSRVQKHLKKQLQQQQQQDEEHTTFSFDELYKELEEVENNSHFDQSARKRITDEVKTVLTTMDTKKMALIGLNGLTSGVLSKPNGYRSRQASIDIGRLVYTQYRFELLKESDPKLYKRISANFGQNSYRYVQNAIAKEFKMESKEYENSIIYSIGNFLVKNILESCTINKYEGNAVDNEQTPAFYVDYRFAQGIRKSHIHLHKNVLNLITEAHGLREISEARLLPMVVPPEPWTSPNNGCYLHYPTFIMRTNGSKLQTSSLASADLSMIYEGLNILGEVPWRINSRVLDIIVEAWEGGGGIGDLPSRYDFELPKASDYASSPEEKKKYNHLTRKITQLNQDLHSLRCDLTYKLDVGKQLLDHRFYFPHNVDFRGRSYPVPPHLNHLGSDFCRSMLTFSDKKQLGERGFMWLKVHLANLYGIDKVSFDDRILFTESHLQDIFDSADNPLDGKRWWLNAEEPWQALATCIEITNAIRSGDPHTFMSSLPVHQDGSCNGLQHYAALGGDELGALKVNLLPSPKPQDVYSGVATILAGIVERDAAAGNEIAQALVGKIQRKIIKQTVMTSVYGVTFIGARNQIQNALEEKYKMDEKFVFLAAGYLARETFKALDQMFLGARNIMAWLGQCASAIAKSGECVAWYTPLGLPVVQPYRKGGKYSIKTLGNEFVLINNEEHLPVCTRQQRSAFPPNYIHSLDSTHMFLTCIDAKKAGITFASVHDSFWTHAGTTDILNGIIRDQFVELHQRPLLEDLRNWFMKRYPNVQIPPLPEKGDLQLEKVRESPYFFH